MASNEDSPEARVFQEHYSTLVSAIQDPDTLADQLFSKRILSREVLVGLQTLGLSNLMKNRKILQCVLDRIVFIDSSSFWVFTGVLKCEAYTEPLSNMLEASCWKYQGEHISTTANLESPLPPVSQPAVKRMKLDDSQGPMPTASQPAAKRMKLDDNQVHTQENLVEALAKTVRSVYHNRPEVREDCWPPVRKSHYINLALLENETMDFQNQFSRYTVRGSVDDIIKSKNEITYYCMFENARAGSRILLEGRPGSGKSTLMNKISRNWAEREILNDLVSLLILVPLRQLASETEVTLETLLSVVLIENVKELGQHIRKTGGEKICFALDGLDEYSTKKGHPDIVSELIRGTFLPNSIVVVASRPAASQRFRKHAARNIEVLGFLKPQIYEFVSDYYRENETTAQELKLYLEHHPNVMHMCYLPIHAAIVTFLFGVLDSKLPETETEIYTEFTLQTLIRALKKSEGEFGTDYVIEHFKDLSPGCYQTFLNICKLALDATEQQKQGFLHKEVKHFFPVESSDSGMDKSLGLITIDHQIMRHGSINTYSFLHLTFQEFLAAYYLTTLDSEEQYQRVSNYNKKAHMHVVCKFLCGLTQLKSESDLMCFRAIISGAPPCTLLHLHCTYESQSEVACQTLISSCDGMLYLKKETVNPSDSSAIVFIVANTGAFLRAMNLESCHIGQEGFKVLAKIDTIHLSSLKCLSLSGTKLNDPSAVKALACFVEKTEVLSSLKIERCGLRNKTFLEVAPSLPKLNHLEVLSIHSNSLGVKAREPLENTLKEILHLMELDIDVGDLPRPRVYDLYQLCKSLKIVRLWSKQLLAEFTASSSEAADVRVYDVIQSDGFLCGSGLSIVLHRSGFSRLGFKREKSVEAAMKTDSIDSAKLKLDLSGRNIGDAECVTLGSALQEYKELEVLNLDHNSIGQEGCSALTAALQQCKQLQVLNLDGNNIGDAGCATLSAALQECKELQRLDLDSNNIEDAGCATLSAALQECKELQRLDLGSNGIGQAGCSALTAALQQCKQLQVLRMDFITIQRGGGILQLVQTIPTVPLIRCCGVKLTLEVSNGFGKITTASILKRGTEKVLVSVQIDQTPTYDIELFRCDLSEPDMQAVAELLKLCPKAQKINLAVNKVGDEGLSILANGLKECQNLKELNLCSNRIGQEGCSALTAVLQQCKQLQVLSLRRNEIDDKGVSILVNGLKECQSLKELHLNHNNIKDDGCAALSAALQECKELQQLDLGWNAIGEKGVSILVNGLKECQSLKELNLDGNNIRDDGCAALSAALQECKELQQLSLRVNAIGDKGVSILANGLKECQSLKELKLWGNNFTPDGEKQLRQAAEERKSYPDFVELNLRV